MNEYEMKLQRRLAQTSITNSALRNQGNEGLLEACRSYCQSLPLPDFFDRLKQPGRSETYLAECTEDLRDRVQHLFKAGIKESQHQGWGTTRKALNLFFAALVSNQYFAQKFALPNDFGDYCKLLRPLEVALDSHVVKGLKSDGMDGGLLWLGVKHLTPDISSQYQVLAAQRADELNLARIHLDVLYWRKEQQTVDPAETF